MDFENMTIEELQESINNPRKYNLTLGDYLKILNLLGKITNEATGLKPQYEKLTFWGKVKAVFSKKPVYKRSDNK